MCESTGESAKIADPEKIKAKHVNNRLFNMNRSVYCKGLICYLYYGCHQSGRTPLLKIIG